MDPDRWDEEKRRGSRSTWGTRGALPSGREIAFVDVPGHERFIGNMLAGVGPVRSVLFVVAADEGWKPQSEEHLQILDVWAPFRGRALTKRDLVDEETAAIATEEVRDRLAARPCPAHRSWPSRHRPATASTPSGRRSTTCWSVSRRPTPLGRASTSTGSSRSRARARW
jgi:translation elongation factor EF-Tu-like GTPase